MVPPELKKENKQKIVDEFFDTQATYWRDTYKENDISGTIYQRRQKVALNYIDGLKLPRNIRVLEIGCGAGFMTCALANRGFKVEAIDHAQKMVDMTLERTKQMDISNQISVCTGDIHELTYVDQTFDLIVALGVTPWLHNFQKAMAEIARVLEPSGYIILTMDNAIRLTSLLDPLTFPATEHFRKVIRQKLEKIGLLNSWNPWINAPPYSQYSPREFNRSLGIAGLTVIKSTSVGFGPFTFFGHRFCSSVLEIKINQKMQEYADKEYPIFRSTGSQYIVIATKK